jgi:hypothetical protein
MAARHAYRASGVVGSLRLSFTDCLGPCSEANVVFLYLQGRPVVSEYSAEPVVLHPPAGEQ